MRSVVIPAVLTLLSCAGVALAALHPAAVNPSKSDRLRDRGHFGLKQNLNPAPAVFRPRPTIHPSDQMRTIFVPARQEATISLRFKRAAAENSVSSDCDGPCKPVSPEIKTLLDATGRTLVGAPPPRATHFVLAVAEEAKRELMW